MDFRSLIQSLDTINEDSKVHKGTYGTSHGKEDVRDQYGHRVGKVNKGAETKKDEPKKGRGRPKKGAGTSGEDKTYDTATLGSVFGGGKKPSKEVGKKSVKHSLKEYIEEAEFNQLNEDDSVGVKPLPGASEITMNNEPTGITAKDPQSAAKIKDLMSTGDISLPGATDSNGVNNSLGEDEFDSDEHEGHDPAEYDMEGDFVKTQLHTIARSTRDLEDRISDQEDLPEWVEMKISQAQGMLASVADYMDSQHERDVEHETGEEGVISEKAKSKAQQRFFGMVHAMQKGKKVPGASKELKGVAKDIGKKDAKDFAKTKHKGLPDHVSETSFEDQGVVENKPHPVELDMIGKTREMGVQNRARDAEQRMANRAAEPKNFMQKVKKDIGEPISKLAKGDVKGALFQEEEVTENGLQRYTGIKKYGKKGFEALQQAGREGASEEQKGRIKDQYIKKESVEEGRDEGKPGKNFAKIAKDAGKRYGSKAAGERVAGAVRAKLAKQGKLEESITMTKLTEGAMKDLLINFYDDVSNHKGDGSVFDLKRAKNVQQAEEVLKALVKHSDEYSDLDVASQNELVNQTLKYLAHEKELPYNTLANVDSQRFANRTPKNMSSYTQHPGAKPGSDFSKPGSPMAVPRTSPATDSSGFLKTLSTPTTFKESNDMKDKQFESWERELNSLLTEGITVSHSTGQQGSPDSLSINATEHDASELMSILRNSGMEMFGGGSKEQTGGYGAPEHDGGEEVEFHQGTEIAPSPDVVGHGDDMLSLIKKLSGVATDSNTPGSVEVDYADEEGSDEECDDCGHSPCSCDDEVDENLEVNVNPAGASSAEQAKALGAQFPQQGGKEPNLAYKIGEGDMDEGNEFSGELAKAKAQHKDHFSVDGKEYPVKEDDMDEGNAFTGKLANTPKGGEFKMGDKTYKDTSSIEENGAGAGDEEESLEEGSEDCMECGYPMESCGCEHVEEGYANDAGGDAMGEAELLHLRELLGRGNDLHRQKHTQATGNIQKVTMETKLLKDTTELLTDWKKLSGIK